ncbi:MAG TPA: mycothiol system anti-sigma-R factor [Nocardioidaceae bacterium]|jgi:mycothiol system anti-sigma-R factor|nr:mycothiol system anti-sigma-R factor [Actinomycetota bacterium]MDQ3421967.1 mycothiol system anti-sigma-R factor [Actinomycetota bacterium]HEV8054892.1 mycothiol system anti-sigma-R factor [Nocardioidaceae bacterium]
MSCGQPHDQDCAEILERAFLFIDNELAEADYAEIRRHLDECGPCLAKYNLEQVVKSLVARSCREQAPPGLRDRVLLQIRHVHVEITETRPDPGFPRFPG